MRHGQSRDGDIHTNQNPTNSNINNDDDEVDFELDDDDDEVLAAIRQKRLQQLMTQSNKPTFGAAVGCREVSNEDFLDQVGRRRSLNRQSKGLNRQK